MESKQRYTITSALPYTNGPLHIGHLAGAYIPADIFARFKRLTDNDVAYICGSDEHGPYSVRAFLDAVQAPVRRWQKLLELDLNSTKVNQDFPGLPSVFRLLAKIS